MTSAASILREEIQSSGPISFRRFMEVALYHPQHGYYTSGRDPFGASGDFYTAEQVQPVFGILIADCVRSLYRELCAPSDFVVVELGAGRGEMASAFEEFRYAPVEAGRSELPARFTGVVFANEFFDSLPVQVFAWRGAGWCEMLVGIREDRFAWVEGGAPRGEAEDYLRRYAPAGEDGRLCEVNLEALRWIERVAQALERGWLLTIDYGYTTSELARFPRGSLMSYRRHQALEDVLADPGETDITAHVSFTALQEHGARYGLETVRFESLAQLLLRAGEPDQFAAALDAGDPAAGLRRRLQLKTLLFGMGETFRSLLQRKTPPQ